MINDQQQEAFEKLSRMKVGALFMEMGTGKTKVALDLVSSKKDKVDYVLWVCPFSLKNEIESERIKWHKELDIEVVGIESIGSSDRIFLETLEKVKSHKTFMIVDESLKIKNIRAKRTERVLVMSKYTEYRLILNGTPISRNCLDLYTQMEFLSPKILNMTYLEFKNNFTEYYIRGPFKGVVKSQANVDYLISRIRPYIYDCELDIEPKKFTRDYDYELTYEETLGYEDIKLDMISEFANNEKIDFYRLSQTLQSYYTQSENKKKLLDQVLQEINDKCIVFVKYLKSIPENSLRITGDMSMNERKETLKVFKNSEKETLYITYGSGSFGLNLQYCNKIIFCEHSFDYAQRIQAEARVYRMGQEKNVEYYNLWCTCGLEQMIQSSLQKKTGLLNEVKKEIEKKGVEEWLKTM